MPFRVYTNLLARHYNTDKCRDYLKQPAEPPPHNPHHSSSAAAVGTPIVSTSANRAGRPPGRNRFQVGKALGGDLDFIVTGDCDPRGKPSTIIDLQSGRTLRD